MRVTFQRIIASLGFMNILQWDIYLKTAEAKAETSFAAMSFVKAIKKKDNI